MLTLYEILLKGNILVLVILSLLTFIPWGQVWTYGCLSGHQITKQNQSSFSKEEEVSFVNTLQYLPVLSIHSWSNHSDNP